MMASTQSQFEIFCYEVSRKVKSKPEKPETKKSKSKPEKRKTKKSKSKSKSKSKPKRSEQEGSLTMVADSFYIPKHNPSKPLGEDAHFFSKAAQVIGVADGVGGWSSKGIDSGIYARDLMRHAELAVWGLHPADVDPKQVLTEAFWRTEAAGSSTALILSLAGDVLKAANVGDSRFSVIRDGKIILTSRAQQHKQFSTPFQLGRSHQGNGPEQAESIEVGVESGDVVVVGTDGLFDNLFPRTIERVVNDCRDWEHLAERLAWEAYRVSRSRRVATPFGRAARKAGVEWSGGGKTDDITVVVARVVCDSWHEHYY